MKLLDLLKELGPADPLESVQWAEERIAIARPREGWADVAKWLSTLTGGIYFAGGQGVTWQLGSHTERLMTEQYYRDTLAARFACRQLGVEPGDSVGRCARNLLDWIGRPQYAEKRIYQVYKDEAFNYHDCTPGLYDHGDQYDVSACYYSLWRKLPCLRVSTKYDGSLIWHAQTDAEAARRDRVAAAVGDAKILRNSLVGCSLGSTTRIGGWHAGEPKSVAGKLGPYRPAAILLCRTAYELCNTASHQIGSAYSMTDSVISVDGAYPTVWEDYGLLTRIQREGQTNICTTAVYKVGEHETHLYKQGSRYQLSTPRTDLIHPRLLPRWLNAS